MKDAKSMSNMAAKSQIIVQCQVDMYNSRHLESAFGHSCACALHERREMRTMLALFTS